MSKYEILNSKSSNDCLIVKFLYIVLFVVVVIIVWKFSSKYILNQNENFFVQNQENILNMTQQELIEQLEKKNNEISNIKNTVQDALNKQSTAIYIAQNFNKIDSESFDNELNFLLYDFASTKFPIIDLEKYTKNGHVIENEDDLKNILTDVSKMKNIYNVGDIVKADSSFNITRNDICYKNSENKFNKISTEELIEKYPECMVCEVRSESNLKNSPSWKNTKTNIKKVCLFNPSAEPNSGIPNLDECKKICQV